MVLVLGVPLSVILGLIIDSARLRQSLIAVLWFGFLALQTAYLARPGRTGFGGIEGTDALTGPVYWVVQPLLLGLCLAAGQGGAHLLGRWRARRTTAGLHNA